MQEQLLQPHLAEAVASYDPAWTYPYYYNRLNHHSASDHLNRLMYVDLKTWLPDVYLEKADKATMACGLEARLPLLDHRLVELAFQISGRYKIRGMSTKRILKQAVSSPGSGRGAAAPEARLRSPDRPVVPRRAGRTLPLISCSINGRAAGATSTLDEVERLWREHVAGRHVWDAQLWLLLNFELWHRISPGWDSSMSRIKVVHITTVDSSVRYLLLDQLRSLRQSGYEVLAISSLGQEVRGN